MGDAARLARLLEPTTGGSLRSELEIVLELVDMVADRYGGRI